MVIDSTSVLKDLESDLWKELKTSSSLDNGPDQCSA